MPMLPKWLIALPLCFCSTVATAEFRNTVDLVSLHYDHAPDKDDAHATVAARMLADFYYLPTHVVSGAYGDGNRSTYNSQAERVMTAAWQDQWLNAHANWNQSVIATADKWIATINAGGLVYVAEGGQADFTADVVRRIAATTTIDTRLNITVIQHSIWNENQSNAADLNYVKSNTTYLKIDDGNGHNKTADLNLFSRSFVNQSLAGDYGTAWRAAYDYLNPANKLDFSDTVELLHILDIGRDRVADPDDFLELFNGTRPAPPTVPETTEPAQTQTTPTIEPDTGKAPEVPACSSEVVDADGDGYAWENNQTCKIAATEETATEETTTEDPADESAEEPADEPAEETAEEPTAATNDVQPINNSVAVVAPTPPICSSAVHDPDGDGYGWENHQSCVLNAAEPQVAANETTNQTPALVFPACSSETIDADGDGFGWENNQTCISSPATTGNAPAPDAETEVETGTEAETEVAAEAETEVEADAEAEAETEAESEAEAETEAEPQSDAEPQITQTAEVSGFPECSAKISDENGDGYGWEDNQTCIHSQQPEDVTQSPVSDATVASIIGIPRCSDGTVDSDNDGYAFENGQSCILDSKVPTVLALMTFPECSTAAVDSDGDGYGWENGASCMMGSDTPGTTATHNNVVIVPFPNCTDDQADPDGDGFGWEYETTCISTSVASNSSETRVTGYLFPVCTASTFDPDKDGYGWENNQTCVVIEYLPDPSLLQPFPNCSAGVVDSDNDGYGWESDSTCIFR